MPDAIGSARFDYFMIRISQRDGEPARVAGLIERLGTGEKRSFESGEQLLDLFAAWRAGHSNMRCG
ncbi:MAG: hypothetical protein ABIQ49_03290 [Gemmatimonadales bacterium]